MRSSLAFACLVLISTVVEAKTIYVNNVAGSNRNTGLIDTNQGDGLGPMRTISAALQRASRGDRITLANTGTPYNECISLQGSRHSGTAFSPFILDGNGATLEGTPQHSVGITLYDVQRVVVHNVVVQGFKLDGVNAHDNAFGCALSRVTCQANGRSGISIGGASRVEIVDCRSQQNDKVQLRTEGWSATSLTRTRLVSTNGPAWTREPAALGNGARLLIDGKSQSALQGFSTAKDLQEPVEPKEPSPESRRDRSGEQPSEARPDVDRAITSQDESLPSPTEAEPAEEPAEVDPFKDDAFDEPTQGDPKDPFEPLRDEPTTPETDDTKDDDFDLFEEPDDGGLEDDPFEE